MSIVIRNKAILLDGTTGGTVAVLPDYKSIQIAIAGRLTGVITVTATTLGEQLELIVQDNISTGLTKFQMRAQGSEIQN